MNILVTGSKGFIGTNLIANLIAQKSDDITVLPFDQDSSEDELEHYCKIADFVFHLAGVNRPQKREDFYVGNSGLTQRVLEYLEQFENYCPIVLTSSTQANLDNDYGKSKKQAEVLVLSYGRKRNTSALIYRLPGVFGKWCRPNYNSVVATFCHKVANEEEVQINGRETAISLVYIDDVIKDFLLKLEYTSNQKCIGYFEIPTIFQTSLGELFDLIESFRNSRDTLSIIDTRCDFEKKLYSTYLSYLPEEKFAYLPKMNMDERGSFTELLKTSDRGQVSVNITKPGIVKGQHWHNTKTEKFIVVSGEAIIRLRKIGSNRVTEYRVSGNEIEIVDIPVGYTHNIENIGSTDMVSIIWCNEVYNPNAPDTYFEKV